MCWWYSAIIIYLQTNVTFFVEDTKNASSTLSPSITLCRCEHGGECFVPEATSDETAAIASAFIVMSCNCSIGRSGDFCEEQTDFCQGETTTPCHPLVTCTNNPTNFTCGPCPTGYEGDGMLCTGIRSLMQLFFCAKIPVCLVSCSWKFPGFVENCRQRTEVFQCSPLMLNFIINFL